MKHQKKICCKDCRRTCCDDAKIIFNKDQIGIRPSSLERGSWLYLFGMIWEKKTNGLWRCRAFDVKSRLCKIFKYRPLLCRQFFCEYSKKKKGLKRVSNKVVLKDPLYKLVFNMKGKNPCKVFKRN